MPLFRRWTEPGATYFFTVVTYNRAPLFEDDRARAILRSAFRSGKLELPFEMPAIVLLPDHLHCIWTLPAGDGDHSRRWREIKRRFTEHWLAIGGPEQPVTRSQKARGYRGIWQMRYWEHMVRDQDDLERCIDYIHANPLKHGFVGDVRDWHWSSFHRFARDGYYPEDWGRCVRDVKHPTISE